MQRHAHRDTRRQITRSRKATMRIHITYTGGTIGMVESPNGLVPGADMRGWLRRLIEDAHLDPSLFSFTELDPLIDSSNATPDNWQTMADDLRAHRVDADAFVVLHGTDTMSYSSAALSYALTGFGKPVIFTGSQHPLGKIESDATANVTGALNCRDERTFSWRRPVLRPSSVRRQPCEQIVKLGVRRVLSAVHRPAGTYRHAVALVCGRFGRLRLRLGVAAALLPSRCGRDRHGSRHFRRAIGRDARPSSGSGAVARVRRWQCAERRARTDRRDRRRAA